MQNIIIEKPYKFIPPRRGKILPALMRRFYVPHYLRSTYGVESWKFIGLEKLKKSVEAGDGIILASNHCRPCDPFFIALLAGELGLPVFIMASWHLFMQNRLMGWLLPRVGIFSMHREGLDREAIKCAIDILVESERPLVIFPEGVVSRTNDRLNNLMDGTVFIARKAAKNRQELGKKGRVVILPVAVRYFYRGDINKSLPPALEDMERRLSWKAQSELAIPERIKKIGQALLTLKEFEYLGSPQSGSTFARIAFLIDRIIVPLEDEWLKGKKEADIISRVKAVRTAIMPEMISGEMTESERSRLWAQLLDLYLAQQLYLYPPNYFSNPPTDEQLLETVERFEEDLTDEARIYRPLHLLGQVGDPIEVGTVRERGNGGEPQMLELRAQIEGMLQNMKGKRSEFK